MQVSSLLQASGMSDQVSSEVIPPVTVAAANEIQLDYVTRTRLRMPLANQYSTAACSEVKPSAVAVAGQPVHSNRGKGQGYGLSMVPQ